MGLTLDLPEVPEFGLWPEHEAAWTAWCAVSSQWRVVAGGGGGAAWIGLDFTAVRHGLDLAGLTVTPEDWAGMRLIEAGAIEELNSHE